MSGEGGEAGRGGSPAGPAPEEPAHPGPAPVDQVPVDQLPVDQVPIDEVPIDQVPVPLEPGRVPIGVSAADLVRWSEALSGIARTGLGFTESLYEKERFEEVLKVAADIRTAAGSEHDAEVLFEEWMKVVGQGVAGYVTPKVAIGAVVGNEAGEILLVQRADSGVWLYPTGWADIGYSPVEVALKEVEEETGILAEPVRLLAVLDGLRLGFTRIPLYSLVFHLRAVGGELSPHPLECADVGWFAEDALPSPLAGVSGWGPLAFAAIRGERPEVAFDPPRDPLWRDR